MEHLVTPLNSNMNLETTSRTLKLTFPDDSRTLDVTEEDHRHRDMHAESDAGISTVPPLQLSWFQKSDCLSTSRTFSTQLPSRAILTLSVFQDVYEFFHPLEPVGVLTGLVGMTGEAQVDDKMNPLLVMVAQKKKCQGML
eukprot:3359378-Amphidinium_carterae.1